jgi:biopolymer transport protein ExbD
MKADGQRFRGRVGVRRRRAIEGESGLQLTSMIDVVFVLLTFFMLSSSFEPVELEMAFKLPGLADPGRAIEMPDEQIVEIRADGQIVLNEQLLDGPERPDAAELESMLSQFLATCRAAKQKAALTLVPDPAAKQQAVLRVLDAARRAGIQDVRFALGAEGG